MEPLFALAIVVTLMFFGNEDKDYSGHDEPFSLKRQGNTITILDRHSNNQTKVTFASEAEANRWQLNENHYLGDPNSPDPKRKYNLHRY